MTNEMIAVLALVGVAMLLMVTEVLRADLLALLLALVLALGDVITLEEAFSGFSHPAVITILAIFLLTSGLYHTGASRQAGLLLERLAGDSAIGLLLITMLAGVLLSIFMQNIAAAAVLMPALMDVARRTRTSPSKLLMPLAFSVNLGGLATFLATANIIVSATLSDLGLEPFGLFDFAPVGLPLIGVGMLYMVLMGRRLLPEVDPVESIGCVQRMRRQLTETYALQERLHEALVPGKSSLVGQTIADSRIGEQLGLNVLAVCREGEPTRVAPRPSLVLRAEDILLVTGRDDRVEQLEGMGVEVLEDVTWNGSLVTERVVLQEVILAPRSGAAGQTLKDLGFRRKYGLSAVALWRGGRPYRTDVGEIALRFGDALLVHGSRGGVSLLRTDPDFLVLAEPEEPVRRRKGWLAALILVLALGAVALEVLPVSAAMMLGALAMIITGCLTMDEAYRGVEWRAIFLLAGMLPVGIALTKSGVAAWLGQWLVSALVGWGPLALAAGGLLIATFLAQAMSGQVAAVVLTPVLVSAAQQVGADPRAVAMVVAMGCGLVFMTPTSHPVNVFVMGPGGYRFRDFFRVGVPLTLLLCLTVLLVLPLVWPLG